MPKNILQDQTSEKEIKKPNLRGILSAKNSSNKRFFSSKTTVLEVGKKFKNAK
jgi:hypothetical protein